MMDCRRYVIAIFVLALLLLTGCGRGELGSPLQKLEQYNHYEISVGYTTRPNESIEPKLAILHLSHNEFLHSIANPRNFPYMPSGQIMAGVVPHHNTAAFLISGFFAQAANHACDYDLVIILGPNHEGDLANVILSYKDWDIGEGVFTNRGFVYDLMAAEGINSVVSHRHMEQDHSASILIPFIYHYLPGVEVAPLLLNRSLSFGETETIFHWLNGWITHSGKNVLLVASIDFSHFLPVHFAMEKDRITKHAILSNDLRKLHTLNDHYLDSPAAMIILLMYLAELGLAPEIVAHTDASEFLGPGLDETTSYMIIAGVCPANDTVRIQLTFTGDIMLHQAQADAAFCPVTGVYNFYESFSAVRPFLQNADLTIGNLETVLAGKFMDFSLHNPSFAGSTPARYRGFPLFSAPDEFGHALRYAGFDLLSTANNHSLDQGVEGLLRTLDFLGELGIGTFGTYRTRQERDAILIQEVQGIRFAFLSYTFGTNGQPIPPGREYLVNVINESLVRADIARAREFSDFVIVMPHMGYEYETAVRPHIQNRAMMMLSAGADVVIAGHPHVVQPMGFVDISCHVTGETRQGFIAYCLGNFISSQRLPHTYEGVILNLYFERTGDTAPVLAGYDYIQTRVEFTHAYCNRSIRVLPAQR